MAHVWLKKVQFCFLINVVLLSCVDRNRAQVLINSRNFTTVTFGDGRQLRGEVKLQTGQPAGNINSINTFLGIQYGAPPTGQKRYAPPEPAAGWTGVKDALTFGPRCMQSLNYLISQSEDCLYLNVYSPSLNGTNPVMVWIHGGGWRGGSGSDSLFDGSSLAAKGVVVVTINYRLGPFGFLTTGDDIMPGNYGMLDQVLALKWVKENIRVFGGNPNSVTIFGNSAGSASCSLHVLSPLSRGLFHRAIMESGSSFNLWGTERPATSVKLANFTHQVGDRVGCRYTTSQSFLTCLQNINPRNLLEVTLAVRSQLRIEIPMTPRVESRFGFLPDYPKKLIERGVYNRVDTLRGFNSGEYSYFIRDPENNGLTRDEFSASFERFFGKYAIDNQAHDFLVRFVNREYLGTNTDPFTIRSNLVTAFAEVGFGLGSVLELQKILEHGGANSNHYLYEMDYQMSVSRHPSWAGVMHAEELPLVFMPSYPIPLSYLSATDRAMGEKVQTMWTNFARSGNPVATRVVDNVAEVRWNRHTLANPVMLKIDVRSSEISFPRPASLRGYDEFLNTLQLASQSVAGNTTIVNTPVLG